MGEFRFRGRVAWKFGDFYPGSHLLGREGDLDKNRDPNHLKQYILKNYDSEFHLKFRRGDIMIAGRVFGGSRDHGSVSALKALGVSVIIAESFGRVWRRRAITNALPVLVCPGISNFADVGDELEVDLKSGYIGNLTTGRQIQANPAIEPQLQILEAGSMIKYLQKKVGTA